MIKIVDKAIKVISSEIKFQREKLVIDFENCSLNIFTDD